MESDMNENNNMVSRSEFGNQTSNRSNNSQDEAFDSFNTIDLIMESETTRLHNRKTYWNDAVVGDAMGKFVESDKGRRKTFSRNLVEKYLYKQKWYYSPPNIPKAPSLMKAWAYFEHVTLARHNVFAEGPRKLVMAERGDNSQETMLYSPLKTPTAALGEWGIGVAMYFSTLYKVALLLLIAGLITLANAIYYNSAEYDASDNRVSSTNPLLHLSAVCSDTEWVECINCKEDVYTSAFAKSVNSAKVFVKHNKCKGAEMDQSMVTLGALVFLLICFGLLDWYQRKLEVRFDENWMTASDYSVLVKNPPKDAKDPEEWKTFFEQWAEKQVTCCTIALDNQDLLKALIQRRIYKFELENILKLAKVTVNLDDDVQVRDAVTKFVEKNNAETRSCMATLFGYTILPLLRLFKLSPLKPEVLVEEIIRLKEQIILLEKQSYNATSVYVTFETEAGQRLALESLDISTIDKINKNSENIGMSATFRGQHILKVIEAPEPSAVRWLELDYKLSTRIMQRLFTFVVTLLLAALTAFVVYYARQNKGPFLAAIILSVANYMIPIVVKSMLFLIEKHSNDNSYQKSLYLKVAVFRWICTVLVIYLISKRSKLLSNERRDLLSMVSYVFLTELFVSPVLRIIDIGGKFKKHIVAPRAKTQHDMNLAFKGTYYNIGERYTDMTKVLFMAVFYTPIFPPSLIFGAVILYVQYLADKYCLMRVWSRAPFVGPEIAQFSRRYFFNIALLVSIIFSGYIYKRFPGDGLCPLNADSGSFNETKYFVTTNLNDNATTNITVVGGIFEECDQNHYKFNPFVKNVDKDSENSTWMTESQRKTGEAFFILSIISFVYFFIYVFGSKLFCIIKHCFRPSYQPSGKDQQIDFSNLTHKMEIYVPHVIVDNSTFPLLACDIDDFELSLIGWNPEPVPYDFYNLVFGCFNLNTRKEHKKAVVRKRGSIISKSLIGFPEMDKVTGKDYKDNIFSIVKQWQPKWQKESQSQI